MWILVYFIILMIFGMVYAVVSDYSSDIVYRIVVFILVSILGASFVFGVVKSVEVSKSPEFSVVEESYDIYSLRGTTGVSGSFFFGSGRFDNEVVYVVLAKDSVGYYQKTIEGNVYIVESDEETPHVEYIRYYRYSKEYHDLFNFNAVSHGYYVIYVPVGAVIINYSID